MQPRSPSAVPHDTSATLAWGASDNPLALNPEYVVTVSPGAREIVTSNQVLEVTGLTNGVSYTYSVYARNASGRSDAVTSTAFVPADTVSPSTGTFVVERHTPKITWLMWGKPPDADFAGVSVRRLEGLTPPGPGEGVEIYRGTDSGMNVSDLLEGQTDSFTATFYDEVPDYSSSTATVYGSLMSRSASARSVVSGGTVTHKTTLTQVGTGMPLYSVWVVLRQRASGASSWSAVCRESTSTTGTASCVTKPARNTDYQWDFGGGGNQSGTRSTWRAVTVRPKVTARASASTVSRGSSFTLSGSVAPRHAKQRVYLQRYSRGAWRNVTSKQLSATSTYSFGVWPWSTFSYHVYKPRRRPLVGQEPNPHGHRPLTFEPSASCAARSPITRNDPRVTPASSHAPDAVTHAGLLRCCRTLESVSRPAPPRQMRALRVIGYEQLNWLPASRCHFDSSRRWRRTAHEMLTDSTTRRGT